MIHRPACFAAGKNAYREDDIGGEYPGELREAPRERDALRPQLRRHDLVRLLHHSVHREGHEEPAHH